jgi:N-dimethylarginine dimethylaminohydrolase
MGAPRQYPWERWFKKERFRISRHRDFHCMTHSMGIQVRTAAKKYGVQVSVYITEDTLVISVSHSKKKRRVA